MKKFKKYAAFFAMVLSFTMLTPQHAEAAAKWSASTKDYSVTITKEWYQSTYVYAAHIKLKKSGYPKFGTVCAKNKCEKESKLKAIEKELDQKREKLAQKEEGLAGAEADLANAGNDQEKIQAKYQELCDSLVLAKAKKRLRDLKTIER